MKEDSLLLPKTKSPNFIHGLKGKHIAIELHNGETISGTLLKYNPYELLIQEDDTVGPIIVMKNFIALIIPEEEPTCQPSE